MEQCIDIEVGRLFHAYEVGLLTEDQQTLFEIHLLDCGHCHHEVQRFEATAIALRKSPAVRSALQQEAEAQEKETTAPVPATPAGTKPSFWLTTWGYLWPSAPLAFRPTLIYIVLLLALVMVPQWRKPGETPQTIHPVEAITLFPVRGGTEQVFHRSAGKEGLISFVYPGARSGEPYRVAVTSETNEIVYQEDTFDRFKDQTGTLLLPLARMEPGLYQLEISNPADPDAIPQVYNFSIVD